MKVLTDCHLCRKSRKRDLYLSRHKMLKSKINISENYDLLQGRLEKIKTILPEGDSSDVFYEYSEFELDRIRAFHLLIHAEIESYFEERVRQFLSEFEEKWKSVSTPPALLTMLFSYHPAIEDNSSHGELTKARQLINNNCTKLALDGIVTFIHGKHDDVVSGNHGIKNSNLDKLLKPTGYDMNHNSTLWPSLNAYGDLRGKFAHKTHSMVSNIISGPKESLSEVSEIIEDIKIFDVKFTELIHAI